MAPIKGNCFSTVSHDCIILVSQYRFFGAAIINIKILTSADMAKIPEYHVCAMDIDSSKDLGLPTPTKSTTTIMLPSSYFFGDQ